MFAFLEYKYGVLTMRIWTLGYNILEDKNCMCVLIFLFFIYKLRKSGFKELILSISCLILESEKLLVLKDS